MAKKFIGGESVDSVTKNSSEVRNPATGATVDTVPLGNDKDVQQAIQAAEDAFKVWSDVSPEDRGNALMNAGELIKKNTAEIACCTSLSLPWGTVSTVAPVAGLSTSVVLLVTEPTDSPPINILAIT